jgi:hypothetical protein
LTSEFFVIFRDLGICYNVQYSVWWALQDDYATVFVSGLYLCFDWLSLNRNAVYMIQALYGKHWNQTLLKRTKPLFSSGWPHVICTSRWLRYCVLYLACICALMVESLEAIASILLWYLLVLFVSSMYFPVFVVRIVYLTFALVMDEGKLRKRRPFW